MYRRLAIGLGVILTLALAAFVILANRDHGAKLRTAAYEGDAARVQQILGKHPETLNTVRKPDSRLMRQLKYRFGQHRQLLDMPGYTALEIAIQRSNIDAALALIEAGADMDRPAGGGPTTFQLAVQNGNQPLIAAMLKRGAKIDGPDVHGRTPLIWAIMSRNERVVEQLIAAGANINHTNANISPLLQAVEVGDERIVRQLLAAGANVNVKNFLGLTPLVLARARNRTNILHLLQSHGAE